MTTDTILKVLTGSRAHKLESESSDWDYRGIHIEPTHRFFTIGDSRAEKSITAPEGDDVSFEIGHFLEMAVSSNPTILELFVSPVVESTLLGDKLRDLFPKVWSADRARMAFTGYALDQRKEFLNAKDEHKKWKFATAYIRVLLQGIELLAEGTFTPEVKPVYALVQPSSYVDVSNSNPWQSYLGRVKRGMLSAGEVIDCAEALRTAVLELGEIGPFSNRRCDLDPINEFLYKVRREHP